MIFLVLQVCKSLFFFVFARVFLQEEWRNENWGKKNDVNSIFIWSHIYLWNKVVYFVLFFVTQRSPIAHGCFMPHSWYLQKALSMSNKGAPTWFETVRSYKCGSYWSLNHFLNENFKNLKLKTVLEFEGILSVVGKTSTTHI